MLIGDSGELLTMGLPDSSQPATIVITEVMIAIGWLKAHVRDNNTQEASIEEQLEEFRGLKNLLLFGRTCKKLNIAMEVSKMWVK